jgi:nucleoside phosphorylase
VIVLTAATPWESEPLRRAWGLVPGPHPRTWGGKAAGKDVLLVETGMGAERCAAALAALPAFPVELAVSSGLAGSLQEGVRSADLVADPHGAPLAVLEAVREAAAAAQAPLHLGRMVSSSRVLTEPAQKRALGENRRALAVDMESAQVRLWAGERGASFLALRAVLDELGDRLPADAPAAAGAAAALRYAAAHWRELPLLLRLGVRQRRAMARLALVLGKLLERLETCTAS